MELKARSIKLFCAVVENRMPKQECYYPENPILNAENS